MGENLKGGKCPISIGNFWNPGGLNFSKKYLDYKLPLECINTITLFRHFNANMSFHISVHHYVPKFKNVWILIQEGGDTCVHLFWGILHVLMEAPNNYNQGVEVDPISHFGTPRILQEVRYCSHWASAPIIAISKKW